jgi:CRP/FNR family transcriptional regulator, cyclic AMP receptor protein
MPWSESTVRASRAPWPPGSLLAGLTEPAQQRLLALGAQCQYLDSGRVLIHEGDASRSVFLLLNGTVKMTAATDAGDALLAVRVGGDIVGELAALDGRPRLATITTAGPVIARVIGQPEFMGMLSRDPELAKTVAASVADKLRSATARRIDFAACDVLTRLARVLHELAERYGEHTPAGQTIGCPLTQTELATLIGASEPTVQRALRQFKKDGIVSTGYRETTVADMRRLRECAYPSRAGGPADQR